MVKKLDQAGDFVALCTCGKITECAIVGRLMGVAVAPNAQQACNYYNRRCGMKSASTKKRGQQAGAQLRSSKFDGSGYL